MQHEVEVWGTDHFRTTDSRTHAASMEASTPNTYCREMRDEGALARGDELVRGDEGIISRSERNDFGIIILDQNENRDNNYKCGALCLRPRGSSEWKNVRGWEGLTQN